MHEDSFFEFLAIIVALCFISIFIYGAYVDGRGNEEKKFSVEQGRLLKEKAKDIEIRKISKEIKEI